jgi:WD40 repeat protein
MVITEPHAGVVQTLGFSPDGSWLVSGGADGAVHFERESGETLALRHNDRPVMHFAFPPDGSHFSVAQGDTAVFYRPDHDGWKKQGAARFPFPVARCGYLNRDTCLVGLGDPAGAVSSLTTAWMVNTARLESKKFPFEVVNGLTALAILPARKLVAWVTDNRWLHVQDITRPKAKPIALKSACRTIAFSPDAKWLAIGTDWDVLIAPVETFPQPPASVGRHQGLVNAVGFLPDGRTLLSGASDGTVRYWDVERKSEIVRYQWPIGTRVMSLAVADDGLRAAAGGDEGRICVWDLDR